MTARFAPHSGRLRRARNHSSPEAIAWLADLYIATALRELCRHVIDEDADGWQKALPVGNESRDCGITSKPAGQAATP
jgi:hypothetical protein